MKINFVKFKIINIIIKFDYYVKLKVIIIISVVTKDFVINITSGYTKKVVGCIKIVIINMMVIIIFAIIKKIISYEIIYFKKAKDCDFVNSYLNNLVFNLSIISFKE